MTSHDAVVCSQLITMDVESAGSSMVPSADRETNLQTNQMDMESDSFVSLPEITSQAPSDDIENGRFSKSENNSNVDKAIEPSLIHDLNTGLSSIDINMVVKSEKLNIDNTDVSMDVKNETGADSQCYLEKVKLEMLTRLSQTEAHFKSQQRGDPGMTIAEKFQIADEKLQKNPACFLSQFSQYLSCEDLNYFSQFQGLYEVDFYLNRIKKDLIRNNSATVVKNRRYSAMQKLVEDGEYFSEEEMKYRDPLLYEEMVGKYLTDDEIQSRVDKTDLRFSSILLKHIDQIEENKLYHYQKESEMGQMEEEEESEDEKENKGEDDDDESEIESDEDSKPKISTEEKEQLKTEFMQIMQEKFITGDDQQYFDYSCVDKNSEYDSLKTIEQDEQDKYFDEDDDFD